VSFDVDIAAAAAGMFSVLGTAATYRTVEGLETSTTVILRKDLQLEPDGMTAQARRRAIQVDVLIADVGDVATIRRNDEITIGTTIYAVDRVDADDGVVAMLTCIPVA
jgi:hypothetical protein